MIFLKYKRRPQQNAVNPEIRNELQEIVERANISVLYLSCSKGAFYVRRESQVV